jgi:WD40 repeat protein
MGAWNPHNVQQIAVAAGKTVNVYDVRSASTAPGSIITNANTVNVRSLAYNPNKANYTAVAGDDCSLRLFDMRNTARPLLNIREHSHWYCATISILKYHCIIYKDLVDCFQFLSRSIAIDWRFG